MHSPANSSWLFNWSTVGGNNEPRNAAEHQRRQRILQCNHSSKCFRRKEFYFLDLCFVPRIQNVFIIIACENKLLSNSKDLFSSHILKGASNTFSFPSRLKLRHTASVEGAAGFRITNAEQLHRYKMHWLCWTDPKKNTRREITHRVRGTEAEECLVTIRLPGMRTG